MKKALVMAAALTLGSGVAFADNTMTVTDDAALGDTNFGLELTVDPAASNAVWVQSDHPTDETHFLVRWRMKLQNLTAPATGAGRNFRFLNIGDDSAPGAPHVIAFAQRQATTGNWRLAVWVWNNGLATWEFGGGLFLFGYQNPAEFQIQCDWTAATAGANGELACEKIGSAQAFSRDDLDTSGLQVDFVQLGFFDFDSFNSAGSAYFDEYESYR